jgi:hypothetical protein
MKQRKFVDMAELGLKKMETRGNIDLGYWHNKTIAQRLEGAITLIKVAYQEPDFIHKKVDRTALSFRKRST